MIAMVDYSKKNMKYLSILFAIITLAVTQVAHAAAPVGPGFLFGPISPVEDLNADIIGFCGTDAANGAVSVTTNPANGFSTNYNTPVALDAQGRFTIIDPDWDAGRYEVYLSCTNSALEGPTQLGPFGIIVDQYVNNTGDEITGSLILNKTGSAVTNALKAVLHITQDPAVTGTTVAQWIENIRNTTASAAESMFGSVVRSNYTGANNISQITGTNSIGRHNGTGYVGATVEGTRIQAENLSTGGANFVVGATINTFSSGSSDVNYIRGISSQTAAKNANANYEYIQGVHNTVELTGGTMIGAHVSYLDLDFNPANQANVNITGDLAFIAAGNEILPDVGGTAYFIKSEVQAPSLFSGDVTAPNFIGEWNGLASDEVVQIQKTVNPEEAPRALEFNNDILIDNAGGGIQILDENGTDRWKLSISDGVLQMQKVTTNPRNTSISDLTSSGPSQVQVRFVCKDERASNYDRFGTHLPTLCEYKTPVSSVSTVLNGSTCAEKLTQNMRRGDVNGVYSSYQKGIITEVSLLQEHINRILGSEYALAAGPVDKWFGAQTELGVKRLQAKLNEINGTNLSVDGVVGLSTRQAINNSC